MTTMTPPPKATESATRRTRRADAGTPARRKRRSRATAEAPEEAPARTARSKASAAKTAAKTAAKPGRTRRSSASPARTVPGAGSRKTPPRRPRPRRTQPPRMPFVLVVVGLLGGALVSLLLLNTVLAQDAFTLSELQRSNRQLQQRKQAYEEELARENSPETLHKKALAAGLKDPERPAFVDPRTGAVKGNVRPPGVPDDVVTAAAAAGIAGALGPVVPPPRQRSVAPDRGGPR